MNMSTTFNANPTPSATNNGHTSIIGEIHNRQYLPDSSELNGGYSHNQDGVFAMEQTQIISINKDTTETMSQ